MPKPHNPRQLRNGLAIEEDQLGGILNGIPNKGLQNSGFGFFDVLFFAGLVQIVQNAAAVLG